LITAEGIIKKLGLIPHPDEGGFFSETYRSPEFIPRDALDGRYDGRRRFSTAIYFLLTPETFSRMHILRSDEIFHFYMGDAVEMIKLYPDGSGKTVRLGHDIMNGESLQVTVEAGVWQGAHLLPGGKFALLGTTVAPGFEFADYASAKDGISDLGGYLCSKYPEFTDKIKNLIRTGKN